MSNTSSMSPLAQCPSCRGSGVAQYGYDDSGNPCGPVYDCDTCSGAGEVCNYDELVGYVHDTEPAPAPDFHERDTWPAPAAESEVA